MAFVFSLMLFVVAFCVSLIDNGFRPSQAYYDRRRKIFMRLTIPWIIAWIILKMLIVPWIPEWAIVAEYAGLLLLAWLIFFVGIISGEFTAKKIRAS